MHFAVGLALMEQLRRKARLRRKRTPVLLPQNLPPKPPLSIESKYRVSLRLLGKDGLQFLQKWKARGHCTYGDVLALLPADRDVCTSEFEDLIAMLLSLAIELRDAPAPLRKESLLLDQKRILLVHPDHRIFNSIARALEDEGAEVLSPGMCAERVLSCINKSTLDGAVLNYITDRLPIVQIANRLHVRNIPIVFYTAFDAKLVARATAHIRCVIITNPGPMKGIVSALAALIAGGGKRRLHSFLDH